jgi:RimJ/RimL family protein N-acetyltransferase
MTRYILAALSEINELTMETTRRIHLDEYKLYKKIRMEALKEAPYAFSSKYEDAIRRTDKEWIEQANSLAMSTSKCAFFALHGRKIIGLCAIYRDYAAMMEAELAQLWLNPDYRGSSYSKELLACAFSWAKENGITRVWARVNYYNERAIRFFEKAGFENEAGDERGSISLYRSL